MGGGRKESKQTIDPWENMPAWMEQAYQEDAAFRKGLLGEGKAIADWMAENPREVLGPSEGEYAGLEEVLASGDYANRIADLATGRLGRDYESEYTDQVVDTTLAGMQRAADRERLQREAASAAVGGTTNTRRAVSDAVADQLTGMNMAEMEAKLREEGFRFGSEMGLKEADLADQLAGSELQRGNVLGSALSGFGELERGLDQQQMDAVYGAGKDATSWLGGLFSGTQYDKGPNATQQTSSQPGPSTFSQILGAGATVLGGWLGSDEEMKEGIEPMEGGLEALRGVRPTTYRYKEDAPEGKKGRTAGLIAQDLEHIPGAVGMGSDGYRRVDPYPVLATVVQAVKELDRRTAA